jgi:hypothetical protein
MSNTFVERDERTLAVENASYRLGYLFLSFGVLVLVAYRSFVHHESSWDLLALVILGGFVPNAYQAYKRILTVHWAKAQAIAIVAAAVLAILVVLVRR